MASSTVSTTTAKAQTAQDILAHIDFTSLLYAIILLIVGFITARILAAFSKRLLHKIASKQQSILLAKFVNYLVLIIFIITALSQLGFSFTVLLSAAGVLTVALGFAAQTSMSNIISGLFLIAERPFVIGDTVTIDGSTGEVLSIDLLSVRLKTFDNVLVRIANEAIIKTKITNLSYYPTRRYDCMLGVAYECDLRKVETVLLKTAKDNKFSIDEPTAIFSIVEFANSSITVKVSVWCRRENLLSLKLSLQHEIKEAFAKENIDIPYPQLVIQKANTKENI